MRPKAETIILAHPDVVANKHYLKYWAKYFSLVITNPLAIKPLVPVGGERGYFGALEDHFVITQLNGGRSLAYCEAAWEIQSRWEAQQRPFLLQLDTDDLSRGYDCLRTLGMPPKAWFVTLHVRESNNWDHATGRNVALSDYFPAIGEIVKRGGWVVRMGNPQMTQMPTLPNVIDYAHSSARSDWMDVFLFGAARFHLGTQSGPAEAPPTFGVPTLLTNWQLGFRPGHATDTAIFKRYKVNGHILSMEQSLVQRFAFIETPSMFVPGVEVISSTPEEIKELVEEWFECEPMTPEQAARQERFDEMQRRVMETHVHKPNGYCRVGRKWLEKVMAEENG
jgi:putative glycosyltransferase (TIGR04372 family)